jgi:YggT family protein
VITPAFVVLQLLNLYSLIVFVWCLGSWIPQWRYQDWYRTLAAVVEPYVNLFRPLGLQYGGLDLTPFVAILVLNLFGHLIGAALSGGRAF